MKTFRIGGVHPAENKLSAGKAIETLALPKQAVFPLSQHIGAPATAIVKKGDVVKVGTKIADAGGFGSVAIFSSVSPSKAVCSRLILVITHNIGVIILVLSSLPPRPVSITAISTPASAK